MIETKRLIIRSFKETDILKLYNSICREDVTKTFIMNDYEDIDLFKELFDRLMILSNQDFPTAFGIALKEIGDIIGIISLPKISEESIEIGYAINPDYHNNGYATEAITAIIKHLFNISNVKKIQASFIKDNEASKRVMEKCLMRYSHTNISELIYHEEYKDLIYYEMKREDFNG